MNKRQVVYVVGTVLIGVVIVTMSIGGDNEIPSFESVFVERGTVSHIVSVTGHIEPVSRVTLAFPLGGRIEHMLFEEGDTVLKGDMLMGLDSGATQSALREAQAQLARQRALLRELLAPLRNEERAVQDATVHAAERTIVTAEGSAFVAIARAFVLADDAVHEEADELFDSTGGGDSRFGVQFTYGNTEYILQADRETELALNRGRSVIETILLDMSERARSRVEVPAEALANTDADLTYIENFLSTLATAVNRYVSDNTLEQLVYEGFQTSIAAARTSIYTARADITAAIKEYEAADTALVAALRALDLSLAGASNETVLAQEAAITSSVEAVSSVQERLNDTILFAPIAGTITRVEHEIGETIAPYEPALELLTEGVFEVEAFIPEADIAKVKLGDRATLTFDAFNNTDVLAAEVVRIALSETFREGVPTYKTTLVLLDTPREELVIRPGMTVDADILTDANEDVLFVPIRSVIHEQGRVYIRTFDGEEFQERNIVTGLRGSRGTIEVISGLKEDEEIVLYIEET